MTRPAELLAAAEEIAAAARMLSMHRIGSIIVLDPKSAVEGGVILDAVISGPLLQALFGPESKLRLGVTVIRGARVERAATPLRWPDVVRGASDLAAGLAFEVDENTGKIRVADKRGRVRVVELGGLEVALRRYAAASA